MSKNLSVKSTIDTSAMTIPSTTLLASEGPFQRVLDEVTLALTEHTYLPKGLSPRHDWVMSVARPAFEALRRRFDGSDEHCRDFCTIGTGAGTDALVAIEALAPQRVAVTDLHEDVVDYALANISSNLRARDETDVIGFVGDLARPLVRSKLRFDVVYENLPNIPLIEGTDLYEGQNSASFIQTNAVNPPAEVSNALLELHYAFLQQARSILKPNGRVLSSIGARCPLEAIVSMPTSAGFNAEVLVYTWKLQSEVQDVVSGYRIFEEKGHGPFHFYPGEVLEKAFEGVSTEEAAAHAFEIEKQLAAVALSPAEAMARAGAGAPIGHTVTVIESTPRLNPVNV